MEIQESIRSFRDPAGWVEVVQSGPVIRHLHEEGTALAERLLASPVLKSFQEKGRWIGAELVPGRPHTLRHPCIWFPSYVHEWAPAMLHRAGALTLQLQEALLGEGFELKDATPSNVLFEGPRPVFVDFLSPMPYPEGQMGWRAYGQFIRSFLIPLHLHHHRAIPLSWPGLARRDGIPLEEALPLLGPIGRFHPAAFPLITLPVWLGRRAAKRSAPMALSADGALASAVTHRLLRGLLRRLDRLAPSWPETSHWSDYQDRGISYSAEGLQAKTAFVELALKRHHPAAVLDLGCNTGHFSRVAARSGARVIALDADPVCVQRVFLEAERDSLDIQPLVADLGRPSPDLGWNGSDGLSLPRRLKGRFDMVFALALIHHLMVTERIPLPDLLARLADWTTRWLVLEWVPPDDPQFKRLAGRDQALYQGLTPEIAEGHFQAAFHIVEKVSIAPGGRTLYLLERRTAEASA